MIMIRLIVNADDMNVAPGVSQGILDCHDRGIVTSTSILINLPLRTTLKKELLRRKGLGLGLHLNITLGEPVSRASDIFSLLSEEKQLMKNAVQRAGEIRAAHVFAEWEAQIRKFRKTFGRLPTHMDIHHQLQDHAFYLPLFVRLARRWGLAFRRSNLSTRLWKQPGVLTTDYLWNDLDSEDPWTERKFAQCLKRMKPGIHEVMCHPGKVDAELKAISSFQKVREQEYQIFSSPDWRKRFLKQGIELANYQVCYTGTRLKG